jgi:hypothetical protein
VLRSVPLTGVMAGPQGFFSFATESQQSAESGTATIRGRTGQSVGNPRQSGTEIRDSHHPGIPEQS